jgi:methionine synthase I (cobalamin-dependent)
MKHMISGTILEVGDVVRGQPTVVIAHDASPASMPTRLAVNADLARTLVRHVGEVARITIEVGPDASEPAIVLSEAAEFLAARAQGGRDAVVRLLSMCCGVRLTVPVRVGDDEVVFELVSHEGGTYAWNASVRGA